MKNKAFDHSKYKDWIDPNRVIPYQRNTKLHTETQIANIVNSIRRFGWQQDVVITADNVLVIGHGRRMAAIELGSDMADSVTGGGLHGKDLSKADVSVNIYAWLQAQKTDRTVELCCAIGDNTVGGIPYAEIVETARRFIFEELGGFEKFAEWGLV